VTLTEPVQSSAQTAQPWGVDRTTSGRSCSVARHAADSAGLYDEPIDLSRPRSRGPLRLFGRNAISVTEKLNEQANRSAHHFVDEA